MIRLGYTPPTMKRVEIRLYNRWEIMGYANETTNQVSLMGVFQGIIHTIMFHLLVKDQLNCMIKL